MKHITDLIHREPKQRQDVCTTHGPFTASCYFANVWTNCPECLGEERQREAAEAQAKQLEADKLAWTRKIGDACIPQKFQDRTLKNYQVTNAAQEAALNFARDFANNFDEALKTGRSAVFIGKPGTGKTHLAVGIALRIMHRNHRLAYFTTVRKAINRIKATWARNAEETELQAITSLATPDLLILDEVGVQFGSDAEKFVLFDIINERYERCRPTLLLSNLPKADVESYLGDRIVDRLKEGGGKFIVFNWESYRERVGE